MFLSRHTVRSQAMSIYRRLEASSRPGVRREYYHEPGAPAATCVVPCAFVAVIADPRTRLVRQSFAVCFHARPRSGSPGGDDVETSDARWIAIAHISALPIRPAMRIRIAHAFTPGRPCHIG